MIRALRSASFLLFIVLCSTSRAAAEATAPETADAFEQRLQAVVARPAVTVVHLWAPWCSNCRNEMQPEGWAKFIAEHPNAKFVFVNIWHADQDPAPRLTAGRLGGQPNFTAFTHPNASRRNGEKLERLLGFPVTWVPTTWVFREGRLRYALNYGEVRFEMLHQLLTDATGRW